MWSIRPNSWAVAASFLDEMAMQERNYCGGDD